MKRIVSHENEVERNIIAYQHEVEASPDLAGRIRQHPAWYAIRSPEGEWLFGPSKFVGYENMTAEAYMKVAAKGGGGDGRATERVLEKWFDIVPSDSARHRELKSAFDSFAQRFGKSAHGRWRVSVPREASRVTQRTDGDLVSRIVTDPEICGGKPTIRGTRVRVSDVLSMLSEGADREEILADYPYISGEDVDACLAWAAAAVDHRIVRAA